VFDGFVGDHTDHFVERFRIGAAHLDSVMYAISEDIAGGPLAPAAGQALLTAGPNPSSGPTALMFDLPIGDRVNLAIYDVAGRLVATVADGHLAAGRHSVQWPGRDLNDARVPKGVYLLRLSTGTGLVAGDRVTIVR
jgi:hypothetical protein